MSARWDETLSAWRQFQAHWGLGVRQDPRGVALNVEFAEAIDNVRKDDNWGPTSADLLFALPEGPALAPVQPIYVSPDVETLWKYAWPSFEIEPPRATDLLIRDGFALFPTAVEYGAANPCRSLLWISDDSGTWAFGVSHRDDCRDNRTRSNIWAIETMTGFPWNGDSLEGAVALDMLQKHQSFWRLAQQVLLIDEKLPRARRREEQRNGSSVRTITVLRLRRLDRGDSETSRDVDWDHRWIVRGHWRNQWYPKLGVHRQIWISPHAKGPEDRPLIVTERIVEFVR